jgi:hypothetical protein
VVLAGEPASDDPRGWLEREVDRQATLVTPAIADDPVFPYSFDEFLAMTESLIRFAQRRAPYVDCQVTQMDDGLDADVDPSAACLGVIEQAVRKSP